MVGVGGYLGKVKCVWVGDGKDGKREGSGCVE